MSKKRAPLTSVKRRTPIDPARADALVGGSGNGRAAGSMKRLTIDVPADLHRRLKLACAESGQKIADVVRDMLTRKYGGETVQLDEASNG